MNQKYSGVLLCGNHLVSDIERRGKQCIRQEHGIIPGSTIALATGGGIASLSLLILLSKIVLKRRDVRLIVTCFDLPTINEAQKGWLKDYCSKNSIELFLCKKNIAIDLILSELMQVAKKFNIRKVALGLTLDDYAFDMIMEAFLLNPFFFSHREKNSLFIAPFISVPLEEIQIYGKILDILQDTGQALGNTRLSKTDRFSQDLNSLLHIYSAKHPSTPFALLGLRNSLPILLGNMIKTGNTNSNSIITQK